MFKYFFCIILFISNVFNCNAIAYNPSKIAPITTQVSTNIILPVVESSASNVVVYKKPTILQKLKKFVQKQLPDYTVGDGYDTFAVISFISLLLSFASIIALVGFTIGSTAVEFGIALVALLLLAILLGLLSFVTAIIAGVRIRKNSQLKGKGFFYASGIYWAITIGFNILGLFLQFFFR